MKKLFLYIALLVSTVTFSQTGVIDFENMGLPDQAPLGTVAAPNGCEVTFSLGIRQPNDTFNIVDNPMLAFVGAPGDGFLRDAGPLQNNACGVTTATALDMPNGTGNGCAFLAFRVRQNNDTANPARALIIDYQIPVAEASFELLDLDGNCTGGCRERWDILAFDTSGNLIFFARVDPNTGLSGSGDGGSAQVPVRLPNNNALISRMVIEATGTNLTPGMAFDNFFPCSVDPNIDAVCCPGDNLIQNGSLDDGMPAFDSDYGIPMGSTDNPLLAPGNFNLINAMDISAQCGNWRVSDVDCRQGDFLVFNGLTSGNGQTLLMEGSVELEEGEYNFCYNARRLENCCFDINPPRVTTEIYVDGNLVNSFDQLIGTDPVDACDYLELAHRFNVAQAGQFTYRLLLDSDPFQDGNDLAIDNISLVELSPLPIASVSFNRNHTGTPAPGFSNWTFTQSNPLPAGCENSWSVCELDPQTGDCIPGTLLFGNALSGWGTSTNLPDIGGTAYAFDDNSTYRVIRYVECDCQSQSGFVDVFGPLEGSYYSGPLDEYNFGGTEGNTEGATKPKTGSSTQGDFQIFPNPGTGRFNFQYTGSNLVPKGRLMVVNSAGSMVRDYSISPEANLIIDIEDQPNGLYLVKVLLNGSEAFVYKIEKTGTSE